MHVPVIDISPLVDWRSGGPFPHGTCTALDAALRDVGFIYVSNHGVPAELVEALQRLSVEFFARPEAEKMTLEMAKGRRAWRGYFPMGAELTSGRPDRKEGLYFGREGPEDGRPLHGANLFPPHPTDLRSVVVEYMRAMETLCETLMSAVAAALGLPHDYFMKRFTGDPTVLFRLFSYAPNVWPTEQDEWGVREHTDYGFLTVLLQDDSGGLQVRTRDGAWVDASPVPGTFVVNIGDMLELWTHGYYRATPHRVRNASGTTPRVSAPFFYDPGWEAKLDVIPRGLLERQLAAVAQRGVNERWDGSDLLKDTLAKYTKYGDFLWMKVGKVFPDLARQVAGPSPKL